MSDRWTTLRIDEIAPVTVAGGLRWHPVRRTLGVEAFGINAYTAVEAGDEVVEAHTEEALGHEEVYVVLSGRATFELEGETVDAAAGAIVFVRDPAVRRHARAEEPGTMVLAIGGKPGDVYTPSPWEWTFAVEQYRPSMDTAAAVAHLTEGLRRYPDNASMIYQTACWEAMAGLHDEALAHLQRAFELDPRCRTWASDDVDLDSIRDRIATETL